MRKLGFLLCLVFALTTLAFAFGCGGGGSSESPSEVAEKFLQANLNMDADALYETLSKADKQGFNLEELRQEAETAERPQFTYSIGEETINGNKATVKFTITQPNAETGENQEFTQELNLVKEDGSWKVSLGGSQ
jgi:hypothetical protein